MQVSVNEFRDSEGQATCTKQACFICAGKCNVAILSQLYLVLGSC